MAFNTYQEGLKRASDLANKAIQAEASLPSLSPLVSPLPTLQKAFPLYISSAEAYSHLLSSHLVPDIERPIIKKKWRLVLERAEKVKIRIEELGGVVGKVGIGDEDEEGSILRRGGTINGVNTELWKEPGVAEFRLPKSGQVWRDERQPVLATEQVERGAIWKVINETEWDHEMVYKERWLIRQGPGADCSVVAGLGVCMEHDRQWNTNLSRNNLYPRASTGHPRHSENGKHIVKLLLNGAWRSVLIDALLPRTESNEPLHATAFSLTTPSSPSLHAPWIPLALKAYFKVLGGYDIRGSDPSPDIYAFTGWIPERISLRDGSFQREKAWKGVVHAWEDGKVLITLGTGDEAEGLVPFHAYGVLSLKDEDRKRSVEVFDPGIPKQGIEKLSLTGLSLNPSNGVTAGLRIMDWDDICSRFETVNLNWDPATRPACAGRHWSWPKPDNTNRSSSAPRYNLKVSTDGLRQGDEVWILLSQHISMKDRPLDDIAIHISEEQDFDRRGSGNVQAATTVNPYSNGLHVLAKYKLRNPSTSLTIIPTRDRGHFRTDFTLQAFAPSPYTLSLTRISQSLPFSQNLSSALTPRNAGGHPGYPTWMNNPQFRIKVSNSTGRNLIKEGVLRVVLEGEKGLGWGLKLLLGKGELVYECTEDAVIGDSGAYTRGLAHLEIPKLGAGVYTLVVSSYSPGEIGEFSLTVESGLPITIAPIPSEGAGLYQRVVNGVWTAATSGGRPSGGTYDRNPRIEVIIPKSCVFSKSCRLMHPTSLGTPIPLNVTLFQRLERGKLGDQLGTSGPYFDALSGVLLSKVKVEAGVYVLVVSAWEAGLGLGLGWQVKCWGNTGFEVELVR